MAVGVALFIYHIQPFAVDIPTTPVLKFLFRINEESMGALHRALFTWFVLLWCKALKSVLCELATTTCSDEVEECLSGLGDRENPVQTRILDTDVTGS
ncbi:hypothetical protein GE061_001276 [Apolygus lucorum]|uniref:Uncharacterized protein n=1 Tax=Apolygus lucorum TaxID=248454 RepID=A0A8S9YD75_APOLU|nr:hypothetical protein GE061_001276 [Apolygus lucorum]